MKSNKNIFEDAWIQAEGEHNLCDLTYNHVGNNLDKESKKRLYDISLYFYRGMFEAASEKVGISKKDFRKSVIYCFRRTWDSKTFDDLAKDMKDKYSVDIFEATEDGLKYNDVISKMAQDLINKGKKSFKTNQGGAGMTALIKLWKDKTIDFNDSPLEKNVKNFFRKLF